MTGKQSSYCCIQPVPSLFVLQATKAGREGLGMRLNVSKVRYIARECNSSLVFLNIGLPRHLMTSHIISEIAFLP